MDPVVKKLMENHKVIDESGSRGWYVGDPSDFAENGRSYHDNPKDWKEKSAKIEEFLKGLPYAESGGKSPWEYDVNLKHDHKTFYTFDLWESEKSLEDQFDECLHLYDYMMTFAKALKARSNIDESSDTREFKSGDKVKALLPSTLDTYLDATFDHYATGQEVRDAGWINISDEDADRFEFYVVTVDWKGKPCKMITNGIKRD